jgi:hypothetical protein
VRRFAGHTITPVTEAAPRPRVRLYFEGEHDERYVKEMGKPQEDQGMAGHT